jgi:hypothetical protein
VTEEGLGPTERKFIGIAEDGPLRSVEGTYGFLHREVIGVQCAGGSVPFPLCL